MLHLVPPEAKNLSKLTIVKNTARIGHEVRQMLLAFFMRLLNIGAPDCCGRAKSGLFARSLHPSKGT
jgi:hypothetical protein